MSVPDFAASSQRTFQLAEVSGSGQRLFSQETECEADDAPDDGLNADGRKPEVVKRLRREIFRHFVDRRQQQMHDRNEDNEG